MEQIFQTVDEGGERLWQATISSSESLIDIPGLAKRLGTTVRHVRRLVAEKRVPYLKVGGLIRFDPSDIAAWLDGHRVPLAESKDRRRR